MPLLASAALLLAVAGVGKMRRPHATALALATAGLPHSYQLVRALGVVELIAGAGTLATTFWGFRLALAACYLVFVAFLTYVLARGVRLESCGCAGDQQIPPTRFHILLNAVAALAAMMAIGDSAPSLPRVLGHLKLYAGPYLAGALAFTYLLYLAAAYLPQVVMHVRNDAEDVQSI